MLIYAEKIAEETMVGQARRAAKKAAETLGYSEEVSERAALVATELGTNLHKHTNGLGGQLLIQQTRLGSVSYLDFWALDNGPGIANVGLAMRDGYSTTGTYGGGLGGLQRLALEFDLFSSPGMGTAIFARVGPDGARPSEEWLIGALEVPIKGETVCGDGWAVNARGDALTLLVVDGLGHGPLAHEAADEAKREFGRHPAVTPAEALKYIHGSLHKTRGAAVAVAHWDPSRNALAYGGIGNISASLVVPGKSQQMVSMNGIAGHEARRVQIFDYEAPADALVVMHSDGINTRWELKNYPGLLLKHPGLIAGVIFRDASRGRDDATVLVARKR